MKWRRVYSRPHDLQSGYFGRCLWFTVNRWYKLKHLEVIPDGKGQADSYAVVEEWERLMKALSREIFRPSQTIEKLKQRFSKEKRKFVSVARTLRRAHTLTNKQIYLAYLEYMNHRIAYTYFFWLPWAINEIVEPWFQLELKCYFPERWRELHTACITRCLPNRMELQQRELMRLRRPNQAAYVRHANKWGYLSIYSFSEPAWTWRDFQEQHRILRHTKMMATALKAVAENRRNFGRAIRIMRGYPNLARIARIISHFNYLRTERVDVWRETMWLMQPLFLELERRFSLPKGTAPFLSPQEIKRLLSEGAAPISSRLRQRQRGQYLLRIVDGRIVLEENAQRISAVKRRFSRIPKTIKLTGAVAYPGRVRGRVKVVKILKDIRNVPQDSIIVSPMTHPDYIMAIHKAAAIVTDEGGISCHAAIVAREFKIPCVISTDIATKVLKDGDRVEVDATKGIIKKL